MKNEFENFEKERDERGYFVECEFGHRFYNKHNISLNS